MTRSGRDLLRAALTRHVAGGGMLVGEAVGVHGVTEGLSGPGLVRTPLSEGAAIGVAAGLALGGKKVVVELIDPAGLARAADVLAELATLRARTNGAWAAPVVVRAPFAVGTAVPAGLRVAVAATADDLVGLLAHALDGAEPVVILEAPEALAGTGTGAVVAALGVAATVREGTHATVLGVGPGVLAALAAADTLAAEGIDVEVVDLRGLAPLDRAGIGARVTKSGRAVVVGVPDGAAVALDTAFLSLEAPLVSLPATASAAQIAAALRDTVAY